MLDKVTEDGSEVGRGSH